DELLTHLRSEELTPAVINEVVGSLPEKKAEVRYKKVKSMELATFCWQLNTMLSGGLSITVAIQTIADEIANPYFEYILKKMSGQIEKGMSFTDCVRQYPKVFGKLCCAIIMAGETGGSLTASLERLAEHYENRDKLIRKVRGAMAYPAFVVGFIIVIVIVLMTLIIPRFSLMFEEFNGELPAFTRGFMAVYNAIATHTLHILVTTAGLTAGLMAYIKTKKGHEKFCQFMLSVPVFGKIILMSFVAMFCKTLGTLIGAGVSMLDAFSILAEMTNNDLLRRGVLQTREKMSEGKNISQSMDEVGFFPGVAVKMAQIGENSGSLSSVMEKTSEYYEKKVDGLVSMMLGMLEPILIISVGGIVLVVILAMYLPIFSMSV
ncbi:MAG: type II secretion system F family protein, partial [Planctomycetota bacterium]